MRVRSSGTKARKRIALVWLSVVWIEVGGSGFGWSAAVPWSIVELKTSGNDLPEILSSVELSKPW